MKRLLLFVCAMFVGDAMAEPTNTSDSFPINELMLADYRYLNSAIYPNTGVYDGDVTANAQYDWDLFSPTAGNYLPANSTKITQCTAGSFCAGATNIHYDSVDQGITACSTLGDNSYTQSAVGSANETDCYRDCSTSNVANSTAVSGNDYYGNGIDTCSASACENGYHTDNNACSGNVLTITWANSDNPNTTCTYGGSITTPPAPQHIPGKTFVGWSFFKRIEYIEGGKELNAYIDLGFPPTPTMQTLLKASITKANLDPEESVIFGVSNKDAFSKGKPYAIDCMSSRVLIPNGDWVSASIGTYNVSFSTQLNTIYQFKINYPTLGTIGIDDTLKTVPIAESAATRNLFVFRYNGTSEKNNQYTSVPRMKLYGLTLWDNGTLIHDFIPVKDPKGVACMYDRVGKQFYYNSGTGNFIAGPDL